MIPNVNEKAADLNVDPRLWAWHRRTYPSYPSDPNARPEAIIAHYQRAAGQHQSQAPKFSITGVVWATLAAVGHFATAWAYPRSESPIALGAATALTLAIVYLSSARVGRMPPSAFATLIGFTFATTTGVGPFIICAAIVAIFHLIKFIRWRRTNSSHARQEQLSFPLPNMIFGEPGRISKAVGRYGAARVAAGAQGEASTARLLQLLLVIPGTTVFHGLRFPGSRHADVDHAVVHGNLVILIDSKQFRDGIYSWAPGTSAIANRHDARMYENHMASARDGYFHLLEGRARVCSVVMLHGGSVLVEGHPESNGVVLASAHDAMDHVGSMVALDLDRGGAQFDNSFVVGRLLANLL